MLNAYLWAVLIASVLTLILFAYDKVAACTDRMRIPVCTLLTPIALGGAAGGLVGMLLFRHKTKKWYFRVPIFFCLVIQAALPIFLLIAKGVAE